MWTASARVQYGRAGRRYATDVSDAEFAVIAPLLPKPKRGGRPRTTPLREVLNAILDVLRSGRQGRMLPRQFPPASTVDGDFRRFWQEGVWPRIWVVLTMAARERAGREASPTAGIVDSQSRDPRSGRSPWRRRRQEDRWPQAAPRHGYRGGAAGAGRAPRQPPGPRWPRSGGRQDPAGLPMAAPSVRRRRRPGATAAAAAAEQRLRLEIVERPPDARGFEVLPRRWVIERSVAWLSRNRRLARDVERRIEASTAMAVVAILQLLLRRLATA